MELRLIIVDECGDEIVYDTYKLHLDLDEDELDIWKARKENEARERYPEMRRCFWENLTEFRRNINMLIREVF